MRVVSYRCYLYRHTVPGPGCRFWFDCVGCGLARSVAALLTALYFAAVVWRSEPRRLSVVRRRSPGDWTRPWLDGIVVLTANEELASGKLDGEGGCVCSSWLAGCRWVLDVCVRRCGGGKLSEEYRMPPPFQPASLFYNASPHDLVCCFFYCLLVSRVKLKASGTAGSFCVVCVSRRDRSVWCLTPVHNVFV